MGLRNLTPWFPASVKPARNGIYIASVNRSTFYRRWDGKRWYYGARSIEEAATSTMPWNWPTMLEWRGLAREPRT